MNLVLGPEGMAHIRRSRLIGWVALLTWGGTGAFAQTDIVGEWGNRFHEDFWERRSGLQIGDFTGLAMTEAGRRMGESWNPSWFSLPENQCRPHTSIYGLRGPADLRISKEFDPVTQKLLAYRIEWNIGAFQEVWMDGRPHPPEYAPHTWEGFSTGEWLGNMLKVTVTHIKAGYLQRNGAPHSDQAITTEYWQRHGDMLLATSIVEDPVYYEEPVVKTTNWEAQDISLGKSNCGPAQVADETPGQVTKAVPHFLPGKNNQIEEFVSQRHVPLDAALGRRETMYPEYLLKMQEMQPAEAKRAVPGRRPASPQSGLFGKWNLSIAKSTFQSDLANYSLSGADGSAPQWRTMLFEEVGDSVKHTTDTQLVTNATNFVRSEYTARLDGKEYPVELSSTMDSVSFRRLDANTLQRTAKDRGKVVETATFTLSPDGQQLTVKSDGTGQGVEYHNVQVFERVQE
jgi:hypothetical protein